MYKARIQALEDELARANDRMRRMASDADKDVGWGTPLRLSSSSVSNHHDHPFVQPPTESPVE